MNSSNTSDALSSARTKSIQHFDTPNSIEQKKEYALQLINITGQFIQSCQLANGAIPWFEHGKLDPWDHSEAIMALNLAGNARSAYAAFEWLQNSQLENGAWYAKYLGDEGDLDLDRFKIETNFVAYPATALWHHYLCFRDKTVLNNFFPMIARAIDFVISLQHAEGDIQWAISDKETLPKDALVTACSSILRSLEAAIFIADILNEPSGSWQHAYSRLANTLKNKPWRFDRTWESKARFSMDWFYPILSGALNTEESSKRIQQDEKRFIVDNLGCKCVSDEPWITIAESSELIMALVAADQRDRAEHIFWQLQRFRDNNNGFWTGWVYSDKCIWPEEKTTWTAAAVSLAADALFEISPARYLFTQTSSLPLSDML